jgi:A/G-specific adenine glycosylase
MPRNAAAIRRRLLSWYDANRRPLPWRRSRDSYRVWIAEVMLQQTRIEVVKPAYRRFLRIFPTLGQLAAAETDDVLAEWSGLGYYTRARALHRAAVAIVESGGKRFPDDYDAARALPGVGAYTAAAVLSIAYGLPLAAVDGNVLRVLSRLDCLPRPDARGEPHRALADALLERRRPGDWNQALMELGQTICLPRAPRCDRCPLRRYCRAFIGRRVHMHPPPKPRPKRECVELTMTVLRDRAGRILLERGHFPYLPQMWLPPIEIGASVNGCDTVAAFRHAILHRDFRVRVSARTLPAARLRRQARSGNRRLFDEQRLARIGRSSLLTKALELVSYP